MGAAADLLPGRPQGGGPQAEGTNVAKYFDRGWCATENAWASLTKARYLSLDLGKMRDGEE